MARKLFCEISPTCYKISEKKEILLRHIRNMKNQDILAKEKKEDLLPNLVKSHCSVLVRRLVGVDIKLQENKVTNIQLACQKINGIVIHSGETFSFWETVGQTKAKDGYKDGLIIMRGGKVGAGVGGGLCQMANMIHWLVLHSPLDVVELHHHSDALFPDERRRVPFGTGTSIVYNYLDYRFKNQTNQDVQIVVWIENGELCGELRSEREFPFDYQLVEENHHFRKEGDQFYRISQVYRRVIERRTNNEIKKELILNNHSLVLYDDHLIPKEQIR